MADLYLFHSPTNDLNCGRKCLVVDQEIMREIGRELGGREEREGEKEGEKKG